MANKAMIEAKKCSSCGSWLTFVGRAYNCSNCGRVSPIASTKAIGSTKMHVAHKVLDIPENMPNFAAALRSLGASDKH